MIPRHTTSSGTEPASADRPARLGRRRPAVAVAVRGFIVTLAAFGCAPPEEEADLSTTVGALDVVAQAVSSTHGEYKFPASIDSEVLSGRATELWAAVYRPTTLVAGKRYPLIIFLHGNHPTCGTGSNPRVDNNVDYSMTGTCPSTHVVVPNHAGYQYIGSELASNEYIVVSINANRGINTSPGVSGDSNLIMARGRLILKHLSKISRWDRGLEATPSSLGVNLTNHIDFANVGIMGHSRGGEGARAALHQFRELSSPWPARIPGLRIRSIFEIAPVDGQAPRQLNAWGLRWAVLLPMCDDDLDDLQGIRAYDRGIAFDEEEPPNMKASWTVWGANHNYYNTQWQVSDAAPSSCIGHTALFGSGSGVTGSAAQRTTGRVPVVSFFRGSVGNTNSSHRQMFNPLYAVPSSVTSVTRIERNYSPSGDRTLTSYLEDFSMATGTNPSALPNTHSNITISHIELPEHDFGQRGADIAWNTAGNSTFFQTNFNAAGSGRSISQRKTLDLRVDRENDSRNPSSKTDFSVQLVNANGSLSSKVAISGFVTLLGPVGGPGGFHRMMQTARIPLTKFTNANLGSIRAVRLTFDKTSRGRILVADIRAVGPSSDDNSGLSNPAVPASVAEAAIAPTAIAAPTQVVVSTGNRVLAVRATGVEAAAQGVGSGGAEIDLSSPVAFPAGDAAVTLRIGSRAVQLGRHPDPADRGRYVFVLTPEEFASVRSGDRLIVDTGARSRRRWDFGPLDKTLR